MPHNRGRSQKVADRSSAFPSSQSTPPVLPSSPNSASAASNAGSRSSSSSGSNGNAVQSPGSVSGDEITPMPTPRSHSPVFALRHGFTSLSSSNGRSALTDRRKHDEPTNEAEVSAPAIIDSTDDQPAVEQDDDEDNDEDQDLAFSSSSPSASSPELRSEAGEDDIEDIHGARFQLDFVPPGPTSYNEVGSDYEDHPDFEDLFGDQDDTALAGVQRVITSPIRSFWTRPYFASATVKSPPSAKQESSSPTLSPQRAKSTPRRVSPTSQQSQAQSSPQRKRVSSH